MAQKLGFGLSTMMMANQKLKVNLIKMATVRASGLNGIQKEKRRRPNINFTNLDHHLKLTDEKIDCVNCPCTNRSQFIGPV